MPHFEECPDDNVLHVFNTMTRLMLGIKLQERRQRTLDKLHLIALVLRESGGMDDRALYRDIRSAFIDSDDFMSLAVTYQFDTTLEDDMDPQIKRVLREFYETMMVPDVPSMRTIMKRRGEP